MSTRAFLAGIAPTCNIEVQHLANLQRTDALFHPLEAGLCALNATEARQAVQTQAGAPLASLSERYRDPLAELSHILDFEKSPYCEKLLAVGKACDFSTFESNTVVITKKGGQAKLTGPIALASTLTEIFLLQYAQGMQNFAWQRMADNEHTWFSLLSLHNEQFKLMAKTPYIARYSGTPLLREIAAALTHRSGNEPSSGYISIAGQNRILFLGGHDTNIANLAGMLELDWQLPQQPDNTPPGGALLFELWRDPRDQQRYVSIKMVYQTLAQLRNAEPLSLDNPPGLLTLPIPGCDNIGHEKLCRLEKFQGKVSQALEPACALEDGNKRNRAL